MEVERELTALEIASRQVDRLLSLYPLLLDPQEMRTHAEVRQDMITARLPHEAHGAIPVSATVEHLGQSGV